MEFIEFFNKVLKVTKMELPGEDYHLKMAPMERLLELKKLAKDKNTAKKAAVLVLFYPSEIGNTKFILILRKTYKGVHSNQVGFPGGKYEKGDDNFKNTALRETEEEVGVPRDSVTVLKKLTEIYIPPSHFFVQPYFAITKVTPQFIAQEDEVEAIIEVDLDHFMDDAVIISKTLTTSYAKEIDIPAYLINNHVVWGATAMMLSEVREILRQLI